MSKTVHADETKCSIIYNIAVYLSQFHHMPCTMICIVSLSPCQHTATVSQWTYCSSRAESHLK